MTLLEILSLIGIDILLSGDNAVVIALAARNVPKHLQKRVIFFGMFGAIVLRILAATLIINFLDYSFVKAVGGIILLRIAYHLMVQKDEDVDIKSSERVWGAIQIIAISDLTMSIDNVIALTSVASGIEPLLFGILISIPIIIIGSRFLMMLMEKYPVIIYIGSGLLAYAAGTMIIEDKGLTFLTTSISDSLYLWIPILMAILLVTAGFIRNQIREINISL